MSDADKLAAVSDRVLKLETYFNIAVGVAFVFGIAGGYGAYVLSSINSEIENMNKAVDKTVARSKEELETFRKSQEIEIDGHVDEKRTELETLASKLKSSPAAAYRSKYDVVQELDGRDQIPTIINYGEPLYPDMTGGAVTPGKNWRFTAKEPGIYSVSAYAAFSLGVDEIPLLELVLFRNGTSDVFLAVAKPYRHGTMVGGTTDVLLQKDDYIDIRATTEGAKAKPKLVTARTDTIRIHFIRAIP